ncbi:MAG: tRNA-dihydrouridine synthase family protein [Patescibacteria group bacterium]
MDLFAKYKSRIFLAPMVDLTDSPFCFICRKVAGKNFVIFREMLSAEAIARRNEKTLKKCGYQKIERPIIHQIFGSNPKTLVTAAKIIVNEFGTDGIDINMGCPVPKITKKNKAGASLMKDPKLAGELIKKLKEANLGVPISVKTRLGWSDKNEILNFGKELQKAGVDFLSVHGRTKSQAYSGKADWEMIKKIKEELVIPIIANGDIKNKEDIKKCFDITKADGVMIGRGALGNPWIFSDKDKTLKEIKKIVLLHAKKHQKFYGKENGLKTFRKHLLFYFKGINNIKEIKLELVKVENIKQLKKVLKKIN